MKALLVLFTFLLACLTAEAGEVRVFINWGDGSPYDYIMNDVASCPPGKCGDCIILVLGAKPNKISVSPLGGYNVELNVGDLQFQHKVWPYESRIRSSAGFKFSSTATARIESSDEYPQLEGVTVSLRDQTVDENGLVHLYIPKTK
jgi:hypothetical protein